MYPIILIAIAALAVLLVVIAMQPPTVRYSRSVTINASANKVFDEVADFRKWMPWSPWEKLDPNTKRTYGGAQSGVGATYAWQGNANVGAGNMKIVEVRPNELIRLELNFEKPFKAQNMTDFTFVQDGGSTVVTQIMTGKNSCLGKIMGLVMSMDKMIGTQFEKGLNDLKAIAESK